MKVIIFLSLFVGQHLLASQVSQSVDATEKMKLQKALIVFPDGLLSQIASCAGVEVNDDQNPSMALSENIDVITAENNTAGVYLLQYCIGKVLADSLEK